MLLHVQVIMNPHSRFFTQMSQEGDKGCCSKTMVNDVQNGTHLTQLQDEVQMVRNLLCDATAFTDTIDDESHCDHKQVFEQVQKRPLPGNDWSRATCNCISLP